MRWPRGACLVATVLVAALAQTSGAANSDTDSAARRRHAIKVACFDARTLFEAQLLDQANQAYARVARAAGAKACPRPTNLLKQLQARAAAFENARTMRRNALLADPRVAPARVRGWKNGAYQSYLAGFGTDRVAPGARRGLRVLLLRFTVPRRQGSGTHCSRAAQLLDVHLVREARTEYGRALRAGTRDRCPTVATDLVSQRRAAFVALSTALASERAGDRSAARADYIKAMALDPGLDAALAGLDRTGPVIPPVPASQPPKKPDRAKSLLPLSGTLLTIALVTLILVGLLIRHARRHWARRRPNSRVWRFPLVRALGDEALDLHLTAWPDPIQKKAMQVAERELRRRTAGNHGPQRSLHLRSLDPVSRSPAPTTPADNLGELAGPVKRVRAGWRIFVHLAGPPRMTATLEPRPGDGFCLRDVLDANKALWPGVSEVTGERDPEELGKLLAYAIQARRPGAR